MFTSISLAENPKLKTVKWTKIGVNSLALVNYKYMNCYLPSQGTNQEMVYLQLKNLTKKTIVVTYDLLKYYNGECQNCNSQEDTKSFTFEIAPGALLEGSCDPTNSPGLKIFSRMIDFETSQTLSDFEIENFKVSIK